MKMLYSDDQIENLTDKVLKFMFLNTGFSLYRYNQDIMNILPNNIKQYIHDDLENDIKEMTICIKNNCWTAASLMSFRIYEKIIFFHIKYDLNQKRPKNLFIAIELLKRTFHKGFVDKQFQEFMRLTRNKGVHTDKCFSKDEAYEIIDFTIWLVIFICSIDVESD